MPCVLTCYSSDAWCCEDYHDAYITAVRTRNQATPVELELSVKRLREGNERFTLLYVEENTSPESASGWQFVCQDKDGKQVIRHGSVYIDLPLTEVPQEKRGFFKKWFA